MPTYSYLVYGATGESESDVIAGRWERYEDDATAQAAHEEKHSEYMWAGIADSVYGALRLTWTPDGGWVAV